MNSEIKIRLNKLKNKEIIQGYKHTSIGILPDVWNVVRLKDLFKRLNEKNKINNQNVLTISGRMGLINQEEYFNKSIASNDKSNYYLIQKGDFAYNKSYSNGYPFGAIKVLKKYNIGILSPLYICFRPIKDSTIPVFYEHYFESGIFNREIHAIAQEGARNHGLLNMSIGDFFDTKIPVLPIVEQQKIADILSTWDKAIELKEKLIEEKKKQKTGLMQRLLTGKVRLPGFDDEWEEFLFNNLFKKLSTKNHQINSNEYLKTGLFPIIDQGKNKIVGYSNNKEKKLNCPDSGIIIFGDHTRELKFIDFDFVIGADGTQVLVQKENNNLKYLYYVLENFKIPNNGYSRHFKFLKEAKFLIPKHEEQIAIAEVLNTADKEIDLLEKELEALKLQKKGLMQLLLTGIVRVNKEQS